MTADISIALLHVTFVFIGVSIAVISTPGVLNEPIKETIWGLRAIFGPGRVRK